MVSDLANSHSKNNLLVELSDCRQISENNSLKDTPSCTPKKPTTFTDNPDEAVLTPRFDKLAIIWSAHNQTRKKFIKIVTKRLESLKLPIEINFIEGLMDAIVQGFDNNYHDASLFLIYVVFVKEGFKDFTEDITKDRRYSLLVRNMRKLPYSYFSLSNSINMWKRFKLQFSTLPEAYHILVSLFKELYLVHSGDRSARYLFTFKWHVLNQLKYLFSEEDPVF